jgi:hypothetical protein
LLLFSVNHEHRGIHIEDDARGRLGKQGHAVKEAVMQSAEPRSAQFELIKESLNKSPIIDQQAISEAIRCIFQGIERLKESVR